MTKSKRTFELWMPFTASSIGITEQDLPSVHNFPIKQALAAVHANGEWDCRAVYFTESTRAFERNENNLLHSFFPLSFRTRTHAHTFGRQWSNSALLSFLRHPPDLVGFYGGYGRFTHTLARICHFRNIPYYVHLGGWHVPRDASQLRCLQEAARVVTFTKRQQEWMQAQSIYSGGNFFVWHVGIDPNLFHPAPGARSASNGPHLLYVGRIVENKGVMEAVQAFRAIHSIFPAARLTVLGSHQDMSFVARIQDYLKTHGLENAVRLPGAVAYEQLPDKYAQADLFIFPSPLESFGFVVIESMACGTPVVALTGSGGPEAIISHGQDGWLTDLPNLAPDSVRLLQEPERLDSMRLCAANKVRTNYTLTRTVTELTELLEQCIGTRH